MLDQQEERRDRRTCSGLYSIFPADSHPPLDGALSGPGMKSEAFQEPAGNMLASTAISGGIRTDLTGDAAAGKRWKR
jgi:hypothetical protein